MAELQLKMMRRSAPVKDRSLPEGFSFRFFGGSEEEIENWVRLCRFGLVDDATRETFFATVRDFANVDAARDCFFVLDAEGRYIATSTAVATPTKLGLVHMVASDPTCRGKGIGHAMLAKTLSMLEERGMTRITLRTDDFRLAAVKTYLDAGFLPVLLRDPESDHAARWDKVREALSYPPVEYVTEEDAEKEIADFCK